MEPADFEPIRDGEDSLDALSSPRDFTNYETYLRRELPRTFNAVLERVVATEINPIDERLRGKLEDMIQEAQEQTFATWRALQSSKPLGLQLETENKITNVITALPSDCLNTFYAPGDLTTVAMGTYQDTIHQGHSALTYEPDLQAVLALNNFRENITADEEDFNGVQLDDFEWAVNLDSSAIKLSSRPHEACEDEQERCNDMGESVHGSESDTTVTSTSTSLGSQSHSGTPKIR